VHSAAMAAAPTEFTEVKTEEDFVAVLKHKVAAKVPLFPPRLPTPTSCAALHNRACVMTCQRCAVGLLPCCVHGEGNESAACHAPPHGQALACARL